MTEPFPIIEVTSDMRSDVEQLGSKPKFWFKHEGQNWLFKEARVNTGEDWSEKVASEIARLLDLPTHHTELAIWEGKHGCAALSFITSNQSVLVHGNELLGGLIAGYDKDKERGQADHTFDNIITVLERLFPSDKSRRPEALRMVGYLILDALVGNTDRHHQNWGVIVEGKINPENQASFRLQLAPTFDHASSLGRELTDEARERFIQEKTIERYIRKGKGGIFENQEAKHGMSPMALAHLLANRYPELFHVWHGRVKQLTEEDFDFLLNRVPENRMSAAARKFAFAFLTTSRKLILDAL